MKIMTEESEPAKASERYCRTIEGYKEMLVKDPNLSLSEYCRTVHCDYRGLSRWCSRHGIGVVAIKHEALSSFVASGKSQESADSGLFVQLRPAFPRCSDSCVLKGVGITFPDGINLTLQECRAEELVSLLRIYMDRKEAHDVRS